MKRFICEDAVKEFSNVCMREVVHEEYLSDYERKRQLVRQGYKVGDGSAVGCNCLIDSLLQLLVFHKVVKGPPCASMSMARWRSEVCEMTRRHLRDHEDRSLRPRLRDSMYKELVATEEEHSRAFLGHHKHSKEIVKFLIGRVGLLNAAYAPPISIVVFSRCVGQIVNPFDDVVECEYACVDDLPALKLFLCNTTGNTHTGLHYDPVTVAPSRGGASSSPAAGEESGVQTDRKEKRKKVRKLNAYSPHDEKPVFLKLGSRCRGNCADCEAFAEARSGDASGGGNVVDTKTSSVETVAEDAPLVDSKETGLIYRVFSMPTRESPDIERYRLEKL